MDTEIKSGYGSRLEELREHLGLSTTEFAEKAHIAGSSMSLILREVTKNPSINVFVGLSKSLNANLNWMAFGEGEMFNNDQPNKSVDRGDFGNQVITRMAEDIREVRQYFEEQLRAKDRQLEARDGQISQLLDLLGKLEGAILEPLCAGSGKFDLMMCQYVLRALKPFQNASFFLPQPVAE